MRTGASRTKAAIQPIMEQVLATGRLTRQDHLQLTSSLLSGQRITDDDRLHINRVLEAVQIGRVRLVD